MQIEISLTDEQAQNALAVYQQQVTAGIIDADVMDFDTWVQSVYQDDANNRSGILTKTGAWIHTNAPTLMTTNAAPAGFVLGVSLPSVWFAVTNAGVKYLIPGFTP